MNKPLLLLSLVSLCFGIAKAQVPVINYGGAKTLVTGTAITPITPTNTGGAIPDAFYGEVKTLPLIGVDGFFPMALSADAAGDLYVSTLTGRIIKFAPTGTATYFAGSGATGHADGTGTAAILSWVTGMAFDAKGDLYAAEQLSGRVRKITPAAVVTTFIEPAAGLRSPMGITFNSEGNLFLCDQGNNAIRKITPDGVVSTLKGTIYGPKGIASTPDGKLQVVEHYSSSSGSVQTISTNGDAIAYVPFKGPTAIATGPGGNLYVADTDAGQIKVLSPDGVISVLAGNGIRGTSVEGVGEKAGFNALSAIVYSRGKLYVTDNTIDNPVKTIALTGYTVTPALPDGLTLNSKTGAISGVPLVKAAAKEYTITATNASGSNTTKITIGVDIPATAPTIASADKLDAGAGQTIKLTGQHLAGTTGVNIGGVTASYFFDRNDTQLYVVVPTGAASGNIVVTNPYGSATLAGFNILAKPNVSYAAVQPFQPGTTITPITPANSGGRIPAVDYARVSTIAGTGIGGQGNGPAATAMLNYPAGISVDKRTNDIYFAETLDNLIRKIGTDQIVSVVAGSGSSGTTNGPAAKASFNVPMGAAADASGNVFVADQYNNLIRKISADGVVSTFAGSGNATSVDGSGTAAGFARPSAIVMDNDGSLLVIDGSSKRLRKITPAGSVTTFVDFNNATSRDLIGLTLGNDGDIYVAATDGVFKVTKAGVTTRFGPTYTEGRQIAADAAGNIYVINLDRITKISAKGTATILAGGYYYGPDDGIGGKASFNKPQGIAYANGKLYVADTDNKKIREISITGYSITPALPEGLTMDSKTGIISGMPTQGSPVTEYTITAANEQGESQTKITLQVGTVNTGPQNITFPAMLTTVYGTADFDPGATSTNKALPITYTSYNTNVATIVNGKLHVVAAGTVKIVASQIGDGTTQGSADASTTLTVQPAPLIIKANDVYTRYPYIDQGYFGNSVTYTGLVSESDIAKFTLATSVNTTAKNASPVGVYTLNAAYGISPNYTTTYVSGKHYLLPPINNIKLLTNSIPCKDSAVGSIAITAAQTAAYTAKLTKAGAVTSANFNTTYSFNNLTAGSYNVCVTIDGMPSYQQCFDVVITEPKDLSVYSVVNKNNATVDLALNGGANYSISLNGTEYATTNNSITLPLQKGKNKLTVRAGTACQGVINKDIDLYYGEMTPFPNPMQETVSVNLGDGTVKNTVINLYSVTTGKLVKTQQYNNRSGVIQLDAASLENGVYSLHLNTDGTEAVFKVIKK